MNMLNAKIIAPIKYIRLPMQKYAAYCIGILLNCFDSYNCVRLTTEGSAPINGTNHLFSLWLKPGPLKRKIVSKIIFKENNELDSVRLC